MTRAAASIGPSRRTSAVDPSPGTPAAQAVAMLMATHGARLHGLALRLCGHRADAEDMVQDAFLQAFRKWHTFRGQSSPGTWLFTIAARCCKTRFRRKGGIDRRTPALSQLMPWQETSVMAAAIEPSRESSPAEEREAVRRVQSEVAQLPEHLRLPLVLKELTGMSVRDTGAALGLTPNTVKTRLLRARLALRKAMTAKAPAVIAPAPIYEKRVCIDLLMTKLRAMDRDHSIAAIRIPKAEICARCRSVFRELDLVQAACRQLDEGSLSPALRGAIERAIAGARPSTNAATRRRRGRPPVR